MSIEDPPHEAVTPAKPKTRRAGDAPPPRPPRELEPGSPVTRSFEMDDVAWIATPAGKGAGGTGAYGLGMVEAVHFARADEPDRPLFEALVAAGRLPSLFEDELRDLLRGATRIVTLEERADGESRGRGLRDD